MIKFRKPILNQTVLRRTKDEFDHALSVFPLYFLFRTVNIPQHGYDFKFWAYMVFGALFVAFHLYSQVQRRKSYATASDGYGELPVSVNTSGSMLTAWWVAAVLYAGLFVWSGIDAYGVATNSLVPLWHRLWVVLVANYLGFTGSWAGRALRDFTAELLRRPATTAASASDTPAAVTPQAVPDVVQNVAPPAAVPLSAGQGKSTL